MSGELLLGVDIGTSTIKTNLIDRDGRSVAGGTALTPFAVVADGVEMTANELFKAVQQALDVLGPLREKVAGVGIASMGETGGTVSEAGPGLMPMVAWHDRRGHETISRLISTLGTEVRTRTGREARSVSTIAKLGWLADNGHDISGVWTGVAGLTLWRLTGVVGQEYSLAATSGAFDPRTRRYDHELLSAAGVGSTEWAPVHKGGTAIGAITPAGREWSGLPIGVPVTIAGHDHPVGVVGAGGVASELIDSMGTGEPLVVAWESQAGDAHPQLVGVGGDLTVSSWPGSDRLMLLWETLRPGIGLEFLARKLGRSRDSLELEALASGSAAVLDNSDLGALQRGEMPVSLAGLPHGDAFAAALEGYAEVTAQAEIALRDLAGVTGSTLLIGGGLRSERWVAAKRRRATHALWMAAEREAVSRGAALLAGVAAGWWEPEKYPAAEIIELSPARPAVGGMR